MPSSPKLAKFKCLEGVFWLFLSSPSRPRALAPALAFPPAGRPTKNVKNVKSMFKGTQTHKTRNKNTSNLKNRKNTDTNKTQSTSCTFWGADMYFHDVFWFVSLCVEGACTPAGLPHGNKRQIQKTKQMSKDAIHKNRKTKAHITSKAQTQ